MTRALFDRSAFSERQPSREFDEAFEQIFGRKPLTVGEAAHRYDSDDLVTDVLPLPVRQEDGE